jgi:hypothetical protein
MYVIYIYLYSTFNVYSFSNIQLDIIGNSNLDDMLESTFSDRKGNGGIPNDGKVLTIVQVSHIAFSGNKYLIQRDHMVEVLQLEQELGPESASVLVRGQEPELEPELLRGQELVRGQEPEPVQGLEPELELVRGQELEPELELVRGLGPELVQGLEPARGEEPELVQGQGSELVEARGLEPELGQGSELVLWSVISLVISSAFWLARLLVPWSVISSAH